MPNEAEIGASGKRIKYRRLTFKEDVQGLSEEDETICTIVIGCLIRRPLVSLPRLLKFHISTRLL